MTFAYAVYRRAGLIVPCEAILFAGALGVACLVYFFRRTKRTLPAFFASAAPALALLAFFTAVNLPTLRYSVHLLGETEADAMIASGVLEDIAPVENSPKYHTEAERVARAVLLTVDGEIYYCMTDRGLHAGDRVRLRYLPQSRMVLAWERE